MKKEVIILTSKFWNIPVSKINNSFRFDNKTISNISSIRFYQFIAAIESNLNVKVSNITKIRTLKDLLSNIIAF